MAAIFSLTVLITLSVSLVVTKAPWVLAFDRL
jgi:hypothetical protein